MPADHSQKAWRGDSVVSKKWLDNAPSRSAAILPAHATGTVALHCPPNQWTLHQVLLPRSCSPCAKWRLWVGMTGANTAR